jgi:hypothetical protein
VWKTKGVISRKRWISSLFCLRKRVDGTAIGSWYLRRQIPRERERVCVAREAKVVFGPKEIREIMMGLG